MASAVCIPVGKYKGRPLDQVVFVDPDYFEWLRQQTTLLQRYPALAKGLTDLGVSGDQTPVHNASQALFLDDSVCLRLLNRLWGERLTGKLKR